MSEYLHITNGDSAADIIENCGIGGDVLSWRDPMHHGPFLPGLSLDKLSRIRIDYLAGETTSPQESLSSSGQHEFSERDAVLATAHEYEEVILWYEHDLLDQLQILQLLDWFAKSNTSTFKLSLICVDRFDGVPNFRGIGQLTSEQMASLQTTRQPVSRRQQEQAQKIWTAFCSPEPHTLLKLINNVALMSNLAIPFMAPALMRHCQEFPWISDGLSRTERQILNLVMKGVTKPTRVFLDNMDFESCLYIGDWRSYSQIAELCNAKQPLLACVSGADFEHARSTNLSAAEFAEQELCVTECGKQVLDGTTSATRCIERNSWLGGVHLNSDAELWLWDDIKAVFQLTKDR